MTRKIQNIPASAAARCLFGALIIGLCAPLTFARGVPIAPRTLSGVVSHVADGDTLDLTVGQRLVRIRLEGIDAPEGGQAFGARSRTYLRVLALARPATAHVKQTDRYGRLVARVIVNGKDLSEEMVAAGLAWHYLEYSSDPRLAALEKQARAKRLGLWADRSPVPPWVARRPGNRAPATPGVSRSTPSRGGGESQPTRVTGPFHGNVSSHVYHAPGCRDYDCTNCRAMFATQAEAEAAGFRPHAQCVPSGRETTPGLLSFRVRRNTPQPLLAAILEDQRGGVTRNHSRTGCLSRNVRHPRRRMAEIGGFCRCGSARRLQSGRVTMRALCSRAPCK